MEQFVRDARIAQIYEGTNGIQAMDLVGRKLGQGRRPRAFAHFFEVIGRGHRRRPRRRAIPAGVGAAAGTGASASFSAATMWLAQNGMADPDNAGAGAYAYMQLMGLVTLGWMWLKMVQVSAPLAANGCRRGRDFHEAKIVTARFFAERELVRWRRLPPPGRSRRRRRSWSCRKRRSSCAAFWPVDVPGLQHLDVVELLLLRRQARQVECVVELHAELAGLRPAHGSLDRAGADDVDRNARARRDRLDRIRPARPSPRCCAGGPRSALPSIEAMARRISRWRGSRMHWKPSASTRGAVGQLARCARLRAGLPKM